MSIEEMCARGAHGLPGLLGIHFTTLDGPEVVATMEVVPAVMAPHGYLHGGTVVALADTACGYGCWNGLPEDATGFATVDLSSNFMGTAREGVVTCRARRRHGGRTIEVWDATVTREDGDAIAVFRCTQMILRARPHGEVARGA